MKQIFNKDTYKFWLGGVFAIILLPLIFKISLNSIPILKDCSIISYFDYTNTGPIGDTIGGITAPFINLFGAILVYVAFKEQRIANLQIEEKHKFDYLVQQIDKLESIVIESKELSIVELKSKIKSGVNRFKNPTEDSKSEAMLNGTDEKIGKHYYNKFYELEETDLAKVLLIKYMFINILLDFVDLKSITDKEQSLYRRFLSINLLAYSLGLAEIKADLISAKYVYFSTTKKKEEQVIEVYSKYESLFAVIQKMNVL